MSQSSQNQKPYILSVLAGATFPDARAQGYTLAVKTEFANLEDWRYYDEDCATHKALKAVARPKQDGEALMVYFEDVVGIRHSED